ncbi:hypothetical protein RhiirA4_470994 [Rhizophagus irregularis]|uniref:Uncharacterized protein n=1 Tax=Rhizophagus irregularis TaxID=588596 RepID=A0A2I1H2A3_9GLOM|nr:hypothetical protein RhiirA4_470994 [Rhizophagus irregularis]
MISRKLSLLATVTLFCMIFIGLTQTAPLNRGFKKDVNINKYEFIIVTEKGRKNIKINSSGGTVPFQKDYEGDIFSVDKFVGGKFIVIHEKKEFASVLFKQ